VSLDKLTAKEAEALVNLKSNPEFGVFLQMLGEDMGQKNEILIQKDMPNSERDVLIGQLRLGSRLTRAIVESNHTLQQHRQPKT
jgi:hypothetical protein